jgi:hypothetical protein
LVLDLPKPKFGRGKSLSEALRGRQTIRETSDKELPLQVLSNLLFSACGVNREEGPFGAPGITAASASNSQEIDVFVALKAGAYRFDAGRHRLLPVAAEDLRALAIGRGRKNVAMKAPVQLIYVVDRHRLTHSQDFQIGGVCLRMTAFVG